MDLTQVVPTLLEGISQELGLESKEFKILLVANQDQIDRKPFHRLVHQHEGLEWDFKPFNPLLNPEPYLEIHLKGDNLLMHAHSKSQPPIATDVSSSSQYTDGLSPASLYQPSSYGSCLSASRSKMICSMEGHIMCMEPPRMGEVQSFQQGAHINQQVPDRLSGSPISVETFLENSHMAQQVTQDWRAVCFGV